MTILATWNNSIESIANINASGSQQLDDHMKLRESFRHQEVCGGMSLADLECLELQQAKLRLHQAASSAPSDLQKEVATRIARCRKNWTPSKKKKIAQMRKLMVNSKKLLFHPTSIGRRSKAIPRNDIKHLVAAVGFILFFVYRTSESSKGKAIFPKVANLRTFLEQQKLYSESDISDFIDLEIPKIVGRELEAIEAAKWRSYDGTVLRFLCNRPQSRVAASVDILTTEIAEVRKNPPQSVLDSFRFFPASEQQEELEKFRALEDKDLLPYVVLKDGLPDRLIYKAKVIAKTLATYSCTCFNDELLKVGKAAENQCFQRHALTIRNLDQALSGSLGQMKKARIDRFDFLVHCIVGTLTATQLRDEFANTLYGKFSGMRAVQNAGGMSVLQIAGEVKEPNFDDVVPPSKNDDGHLVSRLDDVPSEVVQSQHEMVWVLFCVSCKSILSASSCTCSPHSIRLTDINPAEEGIAARNIYECEIHSCKNGHFWRNGQSCGECGRVSTVSVEVRAAAMFHARKEFTDDT